MRMRTLLLPLLVAFGVAGCRQKENFPDIGQNLTGPLAAAVSDDGAYFFILNTDFERVYNTGSILVMDEAGNKVTAVKTPRLGRSLTVAGNDMFVGYDRPDVDSSPVFELYDISDPKNPQLKASWKQDCIPINVALRKGYDFFAVTCSNGQLYVGELAADRSQTSFQLVREFGQMRRGMYLDPTRELLLLFTTDEAQPILSDLADQGDTQTFTYNDQGDPIATPSPNDVPDFMEESRKAVRQYQSTRQAYQFVVYDIAAERKDGFRRRSLDDLDGKVEKELRWLYFPLANVDGAPDQASFNDPTKKTYRTNIWQAEPDPLDPDSFYISQRGSGTKGGLANNIVHVTFTGDPHLQADGTVPLTSNVMAFKRVYGYNGEVDGLSYPGAFSVRLVQGQPLLLLNDFRDLVYWGKDNHAFRLTGKVIGQDYWHATLESTDSHFSYCDVVLNDRGVGISPSYYGASAALFKFTPNVGFENIKWIN